MLDKYVTGKVVLEKNGNLLSRGANQLSRRREESVWRQRNERNAKLFAATGGLPEAGARRPEGAGLGIPRLYFSKCPPT
jgi:hypothetical protein